MPAGQRVPQPGMVSLWFIVIQTSVGMDEFLVKHDHGNPVSNKEHHDIGPSGLIDVMVLRRRYGSPPTDLRAFGPSFPRRSMQHEG